MDYFRTITTLLFASPFLLVVVVRELEHQCSGFKVFHFDGQNVPFRRADCGFQLRWPIAMSHSPIFVLPTLPASSLTIDGGHPGSFVVQIPQVILALLLAVPAISNAASETSKVKIFSSSPLAIGMILLA